MILKCHKLFPHQMYLCRASHHIFLLFSSLLHYSQSAPFLSYQYYDMGYMLCGNYSSYFSLPSPKDCFAIDSLWFSIDLRMSSLSQKFLWSYTKQLKLGYGYFVISSFNFKPLLNFIKALWTVSRLIITYLLNYFKFCNTHFCFRNLHFRIIFHLSNTSHSLT